MWKSRTSEYLNNDSDTPSHYGLEGTRKSGFSYFTFVSRPPPHRPGRWPASDQYNIADAESDHGGISAVASKSDTSQLAFIA